MSQRKIKSFLPILVAGIVALIVTVLWLLAFFELPPFDWRQFSDYQESLTSLFAGLALIFVAWTAFMQREELDATRNIMADQSKTMELQRFETTFFNMLNNFNEIRKNLFIEVGYADFVKHTFEGVLSDNIFINKIQGSGINFFREVYSTIEGYFFLGLKELLNVDLQDNNRTIHKKLILDYLAQKENSEAEKISREAFSRALFEFFKKYSYDLGPHNYFLERMVEFLSNNNSLSEDQKKFYFDVLFFNLTKYEICFLMFRVIDHKCQESTLGKDKFIDSLIFYKIDEFCDNKLLLDQRHKNLFFNHAKPHTT